MRAPITIEEIEAARTPAGGFNAKTLRQWGVPWPPPKGWRQTLVDHGYPYDETLNDEAARRGDPDQILRRVLLAVVEAGQAHILYDIPEALAFTGARIPTPDELSGHHNVDPRLMAASKRIHEGRTEVGTP